MLQRAWKLGPQLEAIERRLVHARFERLHGVLAARLRDVHRGVGVAQQVVGLDRAVAEGDPDRRGEPQLAVLEDEPLVQRVADPGRDAVRLRCMDDAVEQHRELVAAESSRRVGRTHERVDPRGHVLKHGIAGAVSEAVIDRLEIVEIDEQHRQRPSAPCPGRERVPQPVFEQRPVRQAGECM